MRAAMSWLVISRQAVARFGFGEAGLVQRERQLAQLLARELARAREHRDQARGWCCLRLLMKSAKSFR